MRFDNIVTLLDRAKLLKQTSLFELNETIIFGDMHSLSSINPSIHPSIHLAIRPSIHPSVHPSHFVISFGFSFRLYLVGHIFFTFLLRCRIVPFSLAWILLSWFVLDKIWLAGMRWLITIGYPCPRVNRVSFWCMMYDFKSIVLTMATANFVPPESSSRLPR